MKIGARAVSLCDVRVPRSICSGFLLSQEWRGEDAYWDTF